MASFIIGIVMIILGIVLIPIGIKEYRRHAAMSIIEREDGMVYKYNFDKNKKTSK